MIVSSSGCVSNINEILGNNYNLTLNSNNIFYSTNNETFSNGGISFVHPANWYKLDSSNNTGPNTEFLGDFFIKNISVSVEKTYIYDIESIEKFKNLTKNDLKHYGNIIYDKKISVNGLNVYYIGVNNTDQTETIFIITGKNKTCYMILFNGNKGELLSRTKEIEKFISTIKVH